jgi:TFIIH basal transcription factor complex TTD-A subunit
MSETAQGQERPAALDPALPRPSYIPCRTPSLVSVISHVKSTDILVSSTLRDPTGKDPPLSQPSCLALNKVGVPRQKDHNMTRNKLTMTKGVLVHCDASIKAIIMKINSEDGNIYIIEDIDDEHILIQESKHAQLKQRLNAVRATHCTLSSEEVP